MTAGVDTQLWPLAGIMFCRPCQQPYQPYPAGRDRRFYLCPHCADLHPAEHLEHLVLSVAAERDWIRAHPTSQPTASTPTWPADSGVRVRQQLNRLVERITIAPTDPMIEVWWRPIAVLPAHNPWLGPWIGPWPGRDPVVEGRPA